MRRPAGFTLIEVVIATAMILVLVGAFMQLLSSQARIATEEAHDTDAQTGLIRTVGVILPYLEEAQLVTPNPPPSNSIRFRIPLKDFAANSAKGAAIAKLDPVSGRYQFQMGVAERGLGTNGNIFGGFYELIFVPGYDELTGTGRPEMLVNEATILKSNGVAGLDLNQNGNQTDKFVLGSMHLRIFDNTSPVPVEDRQLSGQVAVLSPSKVVFTMTSSTIVNVTLMTLDQRVKAEDSRIRQTSTSIRLRGTGVSK